MKFRQIVSMVFIAVLSTLVTLGLYNYLDHKKDSADPGKNKSPVVLTSKADTFAYPVSISTDFTFAAALTTPSVVHVTTSTVRNKSYHQNDFYRYFFNESPNSGSRVDQASGSGVIISEEGYIVTNYHVVKGADEIEVALHDMQKLDASLVGFDASTDLALLKVSKEDLPNIAFGNSDSVRIGEWVLAVGNPFNLSSTVTAGIVSAKGRSIDILRNNSNYPIESFIQTDAAVNPGNSGGALVNTRGELIGINTAIASPTGAYAGYSFAVPVNIVQKVVRDLLNYGIVQRAYLGVTIDVSKDDLGGIYIDGVIEGTGSEEAGMQNGDVITRVNGIAVKSFPELQEQLIKYGPGDFVKVDLIRGNKEVSLDVQLKNKNKSTDIILKESADFVTRLGAEFKELNQDEAEYYGISGGVKISSLLDGTIAEQTNIHEGFVITSIDKKRIRTLDDLEKEFNGRSGQVYIEGFYPSYPFKLYGFALKI